MLLEFLKDYWAALVGNAVVLGLIGWGISTMVSRRINRELARYTAELSRANSVLDTIAKFGNDKFLKDYEFQLKNKEKAASIVKLLATAIYSPHISNEEFNQMAWELSLWLPANIVCELSHVMVGTPDAIHPKELLIMVRKQLLGDDDTLKAENIVHRYTSVLPDGSGSREEVSTEHFAP